MPRRALTVSLFSMRSRSGHRVVSWSLEGSWMPDKADNNEDFPVDTQMDHTHMYQRQGCSASRRWWYSTHVPNLREPLSSIRPALT